ncbi:MAG: DUF3450 family protein, partial [Opitutales bacterium]
LIGLGAVTAAVLATPQLAAQGAAQGQISETEQAVTDFVFLRQQIAETKNEWRVYEDVAQRRIEFFEAEIEQLQSQIEEARGRISSAQQTIDEKQQEIAEKRAANNVVLEAAPRYEEQVRAIAEFFPEPLQTKLNPLLSQLGRPRQAAQKMAIVMGILNEVDKFNSEWSFSGRQVGNTSVDVLYMGLSAGFYADQNGTVGGVLRPAKDGWEQEDMPELAPALATLIQFYQGELKPAVLTPVPLEVSDVSLSQ